MALAGFLGGTILEEPLWMTFSLLFGSSFVASLAEPSARIQGRPRRWIFTAVTAFEIKSI